MSGPTKPIASEKYLSNTIAGCSSDALKKPRLGPLFGDFAFLHSLDPFRSDEKFNPLFEQLEEIDRLCSKPVGRASMKIL